MLFRSLRVFISTKSAQELLIFKEHVVEGISPEPERREYLPYLAYRIRWGIEVLFYEHKTFWSFGNYMVRNKTAIERYVNLIGIAFAFVQVLPFICKRFESYKFRSPQVIKRAFADQLTQELIFQTFVQSLETSNIYSAVASAVSCFLGRNKVA